jgi:hypothetical protein
MDKKIAIAAPRRGWNGKFGHGKPKPIFRNESYNKCTGFFYARPTWQISRLTTRRKNRKPMET